jgi:hypothetical protein
MVILTAFEKRPGVEPSLWAHGITDGQLGVLDNSGACHLSRADCRSQPAFFDAAMKFRGERLGGKP